MKVYLDDERKAPEGWILVKSYHDLFLLIDTDPDNIEAISFDYYLGYAGFGEHNLNGLDCARECARLVEEGIMPHFRWEVHSSEEMFNNRMKKILREMDRKAL